MMKEILTSRFLPPSFLPFPPPFFRSFLSFLFSTHLFFFSFIFLLFIIFPACLSIIPSFFFLLSCSFLPSSFYLHFPLSSLVSCLPSILPVFIFAYLRSIRFCKTSFVSELFALRRETTL